MCSGGLLSSIFWGCRGVGTLDSATNAQNDEGCGTRVANTVRRYICCVDSGHGGVGMDLPMIAGYDIFSMHEPEDTYEYLCKIFS